MPSASQSAASIDIASCTPFETIVASTEGSVYELIVLRGRRGKVLVRGGQHFATFCPVLFVGSMRPDGATERQTIEIGARMTFRHEDTVIVTSVIRSLWRRSATPATDDATSIEATKEHALPRADDNREAAS